MQEEKIIPKIQIAISVIWFIATLVVCLNLVPSYHPNYFWNKFFLYFISFISPVILYWLGFWIWGDGYILEILKKILDFIDEYPCWVFVVIIILMIVGTQYFNKEEPVKPNYNKSIYSLPQHR